MVSGADDDDADTYGDDRDGDDDHRYDG